MAWNQNRYDRGLGDVEYSAQMYDNDLERLISEYKSLTAVDEFEVAWRTYLEGRVRGDTTRCRMEHPEGSPCILKVGHMEEQHEALDGSHFHYDNEV